MNLHLIVWTLLSWISLASLPGCASKPMKDLFPQNMPTMAEVYERQMETVPAGSLRESVTWVEETVPADETTLAAFYRDQHQELDARFPEGYNPMLRMYVFPHLAGPERVGVPGYATQFRMYETPWFALPGERTQDQQVRIR